MFFTCSLCFAMIWDIVSPSFSFSITKSLICCDRWATNLYISPIFKSPYKCKEFWLTWFRCMKHNFDTCLNKYNVLMVNQLYIPFYRVVGMNATLTRQGPCYIPLCQMTTFFMKSLWSKGLASSEVWTICSNAYSSTWCICSYKSNNFPSMPIETIVKDISFYASYIQICDNQHKINYTCFLNVNNSLT